MKVLAAVAALTIASFSLPALAQTYPAKPITIIVPFPAGALADTAARLLQEPIREALGQPVVIENRAGAGGTTGSAQALRAEPDGYTLLLVVNGVITVNPFLQKSFPFDPQKNLASIGIIAETPLALAVNKDIPVKSVTEFIAYAKANPGKVTYGTPGMGSTHHLAGELLKQKSGFDMLAAHYRGGGPAATDLVAGHIPAAFGTLVTLNSFAQADSVRIIAITESKRNPLVPNIPTIAETVPGVVLDTWVGLAAPAGTPQPVIDALNKAVVAALKQKPIVDKLSAQFATVVASTPQEMTKRIDDELKHHKQVVELTGVKAE
ncbi:MAG: tripartite tricarboxylate transporter substrate binding protein [Pseudolabrys sp.]|nr:tripartite tricarboxylate transporter substrate binding protein [Pseudolabrys sp.]